jgi:hypothetical protein
MGSIHHGECSKVISIQSNSANNNSGLKFAWAQAWEKSQAFSVAVDSQGNTYVTGRMTKKNETVNLDPSGGTDFVSPQQDGSIFISKFGNDGSFDWGRAFGYADSDEGRDITVDPSGDIIVTGVYYEPLDLVSVVAGERIENRGRHSTFVAKCDPDGNEIWRRSWGCDDPLKQYDIHYAYAEGGKAVKCDKDGNIYVTGQFWGTVDFNPGPDIVNRTADVPGDAFLVKFNSDGNFLWVNTWGGPDYDSGHRLAIDSDGDIVVTGFYGSPVDFDPGPAYLIYYSAGSGDFFLSKFDPDGSFKWADTFGGPGFDTGNDVAIDQDSNIYATGRFEGTASFNAGSASLALTSKGTNDAFLAKFDSDGHLGWAKAWGDSGEDEGERVSLGGISEIYVIGTLQRNGIRMYLSNFDDAGTLKDTLTWDEGSGFQDLLGLTVDSAGNPYIAGTFSGVLDVDPGPGTNLKGSESENQAFVIKLLARE